MFALIKRDLLIARPWEYLIFSLSIGIIQLWFAPIIVFIYTSIVLSFTLFFYDDYSKTNRYIRSLPIANRTIIMSRYCSSLILAIGIIGIQITAMQISSLFGYSIASYTWLDICLLILIAILIFSIFIPIYHMFKSFYLACIVSFLILFMVTFIFTTLLHVVYLEETSENSYDVVVYFKDILTTIQSQITPVTFSLSVISILAFFLMSYVISLTLFKKKDLT